MPGEYEVAPNALFWRRSYVAPASFTSTLQPVASAAPLNNQ